MAERTGERTDTRARIQDVALELFTEQGYEATSLREIAERLGVTKAALYYHFKSKEEIVSSFVEDGMKRVEAILEWLRGQPRAPETWREFLRRYAAELYESNHFRTMRFFEQNQASLREQPSALKMRGHMMAMLELLAGADATATDRLRCAVSVFALHTSSFVLSEPGLTDEDRREAALTVAYDLVDRAGAARVTR
ncbi:TetR/AcrR family transcriptional regulator [Rhizomonospora bruguierae]|uniref:TetR/AcrR family transcriptional regulator n=1 Tax=Rhizomonospora bruguierae TaxID=1581705 RepID=UPI001BD14D3C|nr:TetR/AcrR family transcriptional regulator [Micromonospora sp. NBRC 107566]